MAIYEDIHEIDQTDEDVDGDSVDRWRQHRGGPPRPHTTPILIGALVVVVAGVFAIDALRGPSSDNPTGAGAPAVTEPATTAAVQTQASVAPVAAGAASVDASAEPAVADAAVAEPAVDDQIDVDGCMLDVTSVSAGSSGANVECVQKALTAAGFYDGAVDGVFSPSVTAAATAFQQALGLYVDGVVGRRTAAMLGIWPGDDSFVIHTPPPAPGATDSLGFELSSVATTGDEAPPVPEDTGQGTGKRIVYSRAGQRVWAIDDSEHIVRSYLVTGSRFNNEVPGKHEVYSRSTWTTAWNGQADLHYMVRWLDTDRGAIGFHQIPVHKSDGSVYQTEAELGQRASGGCQRQAALDAQFMWAFGQIGTPVYVV